MMLEDWLNNGRLVEHKTSRQEINDLFRVAEWPFWTERNIVRILMNGKCTFSRTLLLVAFLLALHTPFATDARALRHPVATEHPRLLGSRERLEKLAAERPDAYRRVVRVAREAEADDHAKMISMALVCAIERDELLGKRAVRMAAKYFNGPIKRGHVPFGSDLARCAIVYDLCHEHWTASEREKFHEYVNKTVDANVRSETHVFHNAWYGYKHWGYGLAAYATYYENPRAPEILRSLEEDYLRRAAPALELAGDGGGWAEGYYINYWLYEWLFFCEVARFCEGLDYCAMAPCFFNNRAVASMFEAYPGIGIYNSRRSVPMGDGGGRVFGGDRDKTLSARRILVSRFRDDRAHQAVHAFNETTPRSSVGVYAYKDFLWRDATVKKADLSGFKLSHFSAGPGYIFARSSWDEDATYFFFKCGDRFTAHQHLDVGHFVIYKRAELIGDGGHYDAFGSEHDVNYHLRTIAHNTILIHDPCETWPGIRAGTVTANDGGQHHNWPHHNGAVADPADWQKGRSLYDIADILAFEDRGSYLYLAADCTRAYSAKKLDSFIRQIVFIRPGTFVIFDRVAVKNASFKKTCLLQAAKAPTRIGGRMAVTNGKGRLFIQSLLPESPLVEVITGEDLYKCDGKIYPPTRDTGPAPEARIEISPSEQSAVDCFLNVLTATDAGATAPDVAAVRLRDDGVDVSLPGAQVIFSIDPPGGSITILGRKDHLADRIETALPN